MDTDSLYHSISGDNFIDVVRPELGEEYLAQIKGASHVEKIEANSKIGGRDNAAKGISNKTNGRVD